MKWHISKVLLSILILLGCSSEIKWEGTKEVRDGVVYMNNTGEGLWRNKKKMVMEKILTIGVDEGDEDYILNTPLDIAVDQEENIYICDMRDFCIKVYDREGQFLRRIGKRGQGPGEFRVPLRIEISHDNKLIVLSDYRISYFTSQGEYINSFQTKEFFRDITMIPGGDHLLLAREPPLVFTVEEPWVIAEYNGKGEINRKFGELINSGSITLSKGEISYYYSNVFLSYLGKEKLLATYDYPYRIDIYDKYLQRSMSITRETDIFPEPQKIQTTNGSERIGTRSRLSSNLILAIPENNFMVTIRDQGPDYLEKLRKRNFSLARIYYDLYDSEGHYLQSFYWKENGEEYLIHFDKKGFAYTTSGYDEIPRIRKYKISFIDK